MSTTSPPFTTQPLPNPTETVTETGDITYAWDNSVVITAAMSQRTPHGKYRVTASYQGMVRSLGDADLQNFADRHQLQMHCATLDGEVPWLHYFVKVAERLPNPDAAPLDLQSSVLSYAELMQFDVKERTMYTDWLPERALVMVYGPRGIGKSLFLTSLGIGLAAQTSILTWPVHHQAGVLYVDGEMTLADLQERACFLAGGAAPVDMYFLSSELVVTRTGRDLSLRTAEARKAVERLLKAMPETRVVILDNISCLFAGISEDKKQDWEPINAWLIGLRHRGMSVILGHHAGKSGQQRGTSSREDALDTVLALSRPPDYKPEDGCHFHLSFEKARGAKGTTLEALDVRLETTQDGACWTTGKLDASLRMRAIAMLSDKMPVRDIAEELHVSRSYVYRIQREVVGP